MNAMPAYLYPACATHRNLGRAFLGFHNSFFLKAARSLIREVTWKMGLDPRPAEWRGMAASAPAALVGS